MNPMQAPNVGTGGKDFGGKNEGNTICLDCGAQYGKLKPDGSAIGVWQGRCDWCGETKAVTSVRDFGYPKLSDSRRQVMEIDYAKTVDGKK